MSLPQLRDPKQRDPILQRIVKVVVFTGIGIGGSIIALVVLVKLVR